MQRDDDLIQGFCDETQDLLGRWEFICLELGKNKSSNSEENQGYLQELFRIAHNIKGGSRSVGLIVFGEFIHKVEDGITLLRDGKAQVSDKILHALLEAQKILTDWITVIRIDETFSPSVDDFVSSFKSCFESTPEGKSEPVADVVEISSAPHSVTHESVSNSEATTTAAHSVETQPVAIAKAEQQKQNLNSETIRISAQKLDQLIQVIGELSIHQSIIWHNRDANSQQNKIFLRSAQIGQKLTKELYDKALALRMQSLQNLFQRLQRNIIDTARAIEKNVDVQISGADVELDKTVLEKIVDPLTHLVRNAVDHGIESSEIRKSKNKSEIGKICIEANQDAYGVVLTIKDDGQGLSAEKILKKAIEKNLVTESSQLSKEEIYNLIFLPGFSTAEKITDISGRGVGLDVVRKALIDLQGNIKIDSNPGQGTTFTIRLPTSVSLIDGMLIKLCGQTYLVSVSSVDEVISTSECKFDPSQKMMNLRGNLIPIQDLSQILNHSVLKTQNLKKSLLICKVEGRKVAYFVDDVMGQQQIVVRALNPNIDGAHGIMGSTILGSGQPGLIIDLVSITKNYLKKYKVQEATA